MDEADSYQDKTYSPLTHDKQKIRDDLVMFCREEGIEVRDGFMKIRLVLCEDYLTRIYKNLPTRTIKTLLDIMILQGIVGIRRGENTNRWYILIPEHASFAIKEGEDETK
ncbi:MAG: hypothetical protein COU51_04835 [Parcubacteria group bacterium CG10_big_fil_rev_8_21_14_0_10_36_14]|nr:MAG: hypothetical protein COU51_04835 [Parcubacteria group bacterium CG10_big_fil_rev_8_21_14_0_10_36_14]